ncbi:hypothetical protein ACVWYU_005046 [Pseudomonas sp. TE12234]
MNTHFQKSDVAVPKTWCDGHHHCVAHQQAAVAA